MSMDANLLDDLVAAYRILAEHRVIDAYGHVSMRSPDNPQRYFLARSLAPEAVQVEDLLEYDLDSSPIDPRGRESVRERFIHGEVYKARPEVMAVVHNHSPSTIPFGITGKALKPLLHMCASIGHSVPLWDSHDKFGDTALLVTDMKMGRDLAKRLAKGRTALMRGHGAVVGGFSIRHAVYVSIYLELNAKLQMQAMQMGKIKFLYKGEVDAVIARTSSYGINRAWENWCRRAGREMQAEE